ncbi:hypothetical protein Krac_5143 [Ktedonobacter racemifer DSM 44963]|uniref:Uncharacterized protein n=1 Tax=Ktedonobacter racemifer DSM 44963 TaxID=485913 RepID=D6TV23_KTERA|nr:hypothetical protein Krac_5143 [Ktedonobacter racemifer DSM 44963]
MCGDGVAEPRRHHTSLPCIESQTLSIQGAEPKNIGQKPVAADLTTMLQLK